MEKKPIPTNLRKFLTLIQDLQRQGFFPDHIIRKLEELSFPKKIQRICIFLNASDEIINRSAYLFDKFYNLNVIYDTGDLEELYLDSELLILGCIAVACIENGRNEKEILTQLSELFDDVTTEQIAPYVSIIKESVKHGF